MDKVLRFRVSEDERLLLHGAAKRSERKFSDWARLRLLNCARQELGFENSQEDVDRAVERLIRSKAVVVDAKKLPEQRAEPDHILERQRFAPGRPDPAKIQAAQDRLLKPRKK